MNHDCTEFYENPISHFLSVHMDVTNGHRDRQREGTSRILVLLNTLHLGRYDKRNKHDLGKQ